MEMKQFSLRPLELRDSARMLEWMRDPDITKHLQIGGPNTTLQAVELFILSCKDENVNLHRAVVNGEDEYMGTISLKHIDYEKQEAEYAIAMHSSALGTGAAAEATAQILKIAFEQLGLYRVYLNVLQENRRAVRFYQKFGFRYTHSGSLMLNNSEVALYWYEIAKADYMEYFC